MKKVIASLLTLSLALSITFVAFAATNVYQVKTDFTSLPDVYNVPIPAADSLPLKPFDSSLVDYSCQLGTTGISMAGGSIIVKPINLNYICIIGSGWNAPLANIYPRPTGPTIVANGEDDYQVVINFTEPVMGVGFELITNSSASEMITLTYADTTTDIINDAGLGTEPNAVEFVGFRSSKPIKQVKIDTTGGALQNEGITGIWVIKNSPPNVIAGGAYSGDLGTSININGASAADPNGDPLTIAWTEAYAYCAITNPSSITPSIMCTDVGAYTITLTVSDGIAAPVVRTATVNVGDPF